MADGGAPDVRLEALTRRGTREPGLRRSATLPARASRAQIDRLVHERNDLIVAQYNRPRTRGDCLPGGCNGARPCPWVSCKAHLALDVDEINGSMKVNFPDIEVWEMRDTCALDVADRDGITLEEVGELMNLTRERVRQLELQALSGAAQSTELVTTLDAPPAMQRAPIVRKRKGGPRVKPVVSVTPPQRTYAAAYLAGDSVGDVAREHHVSTRTVLRALRACGVEIRPRGRTRSHLLARARTLLSQGHDVHSAALAVGLPVARIRSMIAYDLGAR